MKGTMKRLSIAVIPVLVFLLTGCPNKSNLKQINSITQIRCSLQYKEAGTMVFKDEASWEGFWVENCKVVDASGTQMEAPVVDFSERMLIGVFFGEKPTGGYGISITRILEDSKKLVVEYTEREPAPDAAVTMAFTYPCHIVSLPLSDKTVEFKKLED